MSLFSPPNHQSRGILTEIKRRENPFVEQDDRGAEGDPDTAKLRVSRAARP
jgi:hypothetical protein